MSTIDGVCFLLMFYTTIIYFAV